MEKYDLCVIGGGPSGYAAAMRAVDFNKSVLLVFFLELSALGNLRVDAKMNKELISIKIDVESQDIANFIDSHLKEFSAGLEEMGFEVNASCFVVRKIVDNLGQNFENFEKYRKFEKMIERGAPALRVIRAGTRLTVHRSLPYQNSS